MNANYVSVGGLNVAKTLYNLVRDEIAQGTGIDPDAFWNSLGGIVRDLGQKNRALLDKRDDLQSRINAWHRDKLRSDVSEYSGVLRF